MYRSYSKYNTSTSRAVVYFMATGLQCDRVICEGKKQQKTPLLQIYRFFTQQTYKMKRPVLSECVSVPLPAPTELRKRVLKYLASVC